MVRFGRISVDLPGRSVLLDGEPQHLEPQAFDLFAYLVNNRDRVVPKAELLDEVWGDQFVSESALTTRVKEIRRALGDDGTRQEVVKNFRGRGYRFMPDVDDRATIETGLSTGSGVPDAPHSTHLFGRSRDIGAAVELVRRASVVTLVGPGGVGKSSLSREVGRRLGEQFRDGVRVVRLARVREPGDLVHAVRLDTGLADAGAGEADLFAAVATLDALVVIDNCEHLIDEAARVVAAIDEVAGPVRILTTSRERLGVAGEQAWPVAPLEGQAARELLVARARSIRPEYDVPPSDDGHVGRLLEMVDHLPLGIEMAAAHLPSLGPADLVEHLTDRLDLLRSPTRGDAERHQSLTALVEWSERLLDPDSQDVLVELSVFAGANSLDDIAAVIGAEPSALALGPIADLTEKSLVVADSTKRPTSYRMLEIVRAVVAPRRSPAVDERHARHIADVLDEADRGLRSIDEPTAAARIDNVIAEIRVAHRWARRNDLDLAGRLTAPLLLYMTERHWPEPAEWCAEVLAAASPDVDTAAFAAAVAVDAANRGEYELAERLGLEARASSDVRVAGCGLDTLSSVGVYRGDLVVARAYASQLFDLGEESGDAHLWTLGLLSHVLSHVYEGRPDEAQRVLDERRPPAPLGATDVAWTAYAEAEIRAVEGRTDEALESFERAISLAHSVGGRFVADVAEVSRLAALSRDGDIDVAVAAFIPVLVRYGRIRSITHAVTALRNVVWLLVRAERDQPAMEVLGALEGSDTKSTYGIESDLLDRARAAVRARHPAQHVDEWLSNGAGKQPTWAIDHAIAALRQHGKQ